MIVFANIQFFLAGTGLVGCGRSSQSQLTNRNQQTQEKAVKQRSELLSFLQHADFVSSGCSATRRKFLEGSKPPPHHTGGVGRNHWVTQQK